jgi:ligand-binding sensor domain-containing protein
MAKFYLYNPIYSLLLVLMFFTSCNGQTNTQSQTDSVSESKKIPAGQPKIIKPTGRNRDDNIYCGLQDKAGNLWFCSQGEGVYRYDGKLFTNFTEKDGLSSNEVHCILEDKTGNIWFGTDASICRYDGKTFTSIPIVVTNAIYFYPINPPNNNSSAKKEVRSIFQDKSGTLWFGTTDGLYCYDGKTFTRFLDNKSIINKDSVQLKWVDCIVEDKNGNLWFASGPIAFEGICRYDGKSVTNFKPDGDRWIRSMLEDKNGNIWIGTRHKGLWRYDGKNYSNFSEKEGLDSNVVYSVTSILEDKAGNIWFGEEGTGLWCYDGKTFKNFTTKNGLINNSVWCIVEDKTGNIWVGSRGNGLCRYDGKIFTHFTE